MRREGWISGWTLTAESMMSQSPERGMTVADIRFCAAMLAMVCSGLIASGRPMDYVDPFIGTSGTGHTHPAACVPFGLVQAGPDTGNYGWDHCSGYRYEESVIIGFSQTRLSGTGARDLGDAMIMPVADGPMGEGFPWSRFRKETEKAGPGWYRVTVTGASDQGELAQIPVTLFSMGTACGTFTWNGTGGKPVSFTKRIPLFSRFTANRLFFAQSGMHMESIRFELLTTDFDFAAMGDTDPGAPAAEDSAGA